MNKSIVILIGALFFVSVAWAQTNVYTLDEIVQLARSKSPAWLSAETRKENEYWQFKTYKSDYNPQLVLDGTLPAFRNTVTAVQQYNGSQDFFAVHDNTIQLNLGLKQIVSVTGGEVSVYTNMQRYDNYQTPFTKYGGSPVSIGLKQPVFQFNPYKWNKKIKPLEYEESQRAYFEELEQISINTTRRFFDLMLAQINLEIARKNVDSNDTIYQIAKGRFNLGNITENDLLQLELNLLNSKLDVSQALVDQQSALLNLKSFVGLSDTDSIRLVLPENIPDFAVDEDIALSEARKNKSDMVGFKRRELEAQQEVARERQSTGVNMDLVASYGLNNEGPTINDVYINPESGLQFGLEMTVPVLDWGRQKARVKTAEANQKLVEYQLIQDEATFDQDVLTQVRNFNLLRDQLGAKLRADEISQKAYTVSKQLFLIGKITITELNASLASKDKAKQEYISSLRDFWLAYYNLREKTLYDFQRNQLLLRDIQTN
ncbi:MAG: TolC family protein [Cyclobacteriaceae bacterium]|nr:TolC family protein [Cyclobacteriaceae bacterium]